MTSTYDRLPDGIKQALDESTWPSEKAIIKAKMQATKTFRELPIGTIVSLILFGIQGQVGTEVYENRWQLLQTLTQIEQIFQKPIPIRPNQNQNQNHEQ
jgi:hypothetical protein